MQATSLNFLTLQLILSVLLNCAVLYYVVLHYIASRSVVPWLTVLCLTVLLLTASAHCPGFSKHELLFFCCCGAATQRWSWPPHSWGYLDHTQQRTTVGRAPLDEWSARRRDHYLTTHNTHNRQTSMPPVRFEPTISAGERPQTYALDRAATGTGKHKKCRNE
jgi:hypothetical protein